MASTSSSLPPPQQAAMLTQKLYDPDPDIRYMSLNDLIAIFNNSGTFFATDFIACGKTVDGFLHTLNDPNGEVQNLTIKCLGPFVHKAHPDILCPLIHKIGMLEIDNNVDSSITALAIREIVVSLPHPQISGPRSKQVTDAYSAISKVLIPRLIGRVIIQQSDKSLPDPPKGLLQTDLETGSDSNNIDILTEIARCFGPMLQKAEVQALQEMTTKLLDSERSGSVMRKKATTALSALAPYFSDSLLSNVVSHIIEALKNPHLTLVSHRLYLTVVGSMSRAIPKKFGPHLLTLTPFVIQPLNETELDAEMQASDEAGHDAQADEVKEAALLSLESFVSSCSQDFSRYYGEAIDAALRCLKYDPNYTGEDDDEEEEADIDDDLELDEDFEEEGVADDDDDQSWRVRRSAAKLLQTLISMHAKEILDNADTYDRLARALVDRFKEREESVRLEDISTLALLIRQTASQDEAASTNIVVPIDTVATTIPSRKRRRRESDVSMSDSYKIRRLTGSTSPESLTPPPTGPTSSLEKVTPDVVIGILKILKTGSLATKQASMATLKDLVIARHGGIQDSLETVVSSLVENIQNSGSDVRAVVNLSSSTSSATVSTLGIVSLQLLSEVCKTHPSKSIQQHLTRLIPCVVSASRSRAPRVACEALQCIEQLLKVITPPRSAATAQKTPAQIQELLDAVVAPLASKAADTTVRQEAIRVLAVVLGRTSTSKSSKLVDAKRRAECLNLLLDSLKNETTRLAAIQAVNSMALIVADTSEFGEAWLSSICLELAAQLRKADRTLRSSSLQALRTVLAERQGYDSISKEAAGQIEGQIVPLLQTDDLQMIGPALQIYAAHVNSNKYSGVPATLTEAIVHLLKSANSGSVIDQLCHLMKMFGSNGGGDVVMDKLLKDVGIDGKASIVGKVIGTLLVAGGKSIPVTVEDFLKELKAQKQDERKCLALSILGEVGLLSGKKAPFKPDLFLEYFDKSSDKVSLDAAIALGRSAAGSGNASTYLPAIITATQSGPETCYLALHAIRETLQYAEKPEDLVAFGAQLWDIAVTASMLTNSREIGAECIANLVILDPKTALPKLQALLEDAAPGPRSVAILAFRDVYTLSDNTFDKYLRPITVEVITNVMRDSDLENRRSALNTFNAAARNKPTLILPYMGQLLPLVLDQTMEDPSLIREVTMGPFKHRVDDGLECRKSAYETMYSIVEVAPDRIDLTKIYDRVVAGIGDDYNIRSLCYLMVNKFIKLAPDEVSRRLDDLASKFHTILAQKLKETAVRHEVERLDEGKAGAIRLFLALKRGLPNAGGAKWRELDDEIQREHKKMVDDVLRPKEGA